MGLTQIGLDGRMGGNYKMSRKRKSEIQNDQMMKKIPLPNMLA